MEYKKISSPADYIKGREHFEVFKFLRITVRPAVAGEEVITIDSDNGHVEETRNIAEEGDYVINNVGSQVDQWIIKPDVLERKYEPDNRIIDGMPVYRPRGGHMFAYPVDEAIAITAPWGKEQRIDAGGFLLQDPANKTDIYGISEKTFKKTYQKI